jgi:putative hydrolase of the HAD superfamily
MKNPSWVKDIKVLVWDIDGTFYSITKTPEYQKIYWHSLLTGLQKLWGLSPEETKKRFLARLVKEKGHTKTLTSFGITAPLFVEEKVYKNMDFNKLLKIDKKLVLLLKQLSFLRQGILSNNSYGTCLKKISALGLQPGFFDWFVCSYDVGVYKPDVQIFEYVLKKTNLLPKNHLYIGDSVAKDIIPAHKAGMHTGLVWGHSETADISFPTVYDVVKLWQ